MPMHWPLVGRDRDVAEVVAMLGDSDVRGTALTGQAGVGKSRVAREVVLRAAAAGWVTRTITATTTSQSIPLGAFVQWTDDMDSGAAAVVRRVSEAVVVGASTGRTLLYVDDAHMLDDLSALVVQRLVQSRAVKILLTMRTGEPVPAAVSALWKDDDIVWREVDPLNSGEVSEALHAAFGARPDQLVVERFWGLTQGNMLFARQLADQETAAGRLSPVDGALRWEGTVTVHGSLADLVETQVGALRDRVLDVIDTVAVAEPVDVRCLALLADHQAVEEAEQRGLIRVVDQQVFIGHPLFADIRRGRCGTTRLRRLRGGVAAAMGDAGTRAEFVKRGLLWLESDLPPNPELLLSAADSANSLLAFDVAERLFAAAGDTGTGPAVHVSRALSLFMMGEGELTNEALEGAPSEGDTGPPGYVNDVVMRASNALWTLRAPAEATRIIDDALQTETGERRQQLLVFRAIQLALAGRTVEVVETLATIDHRVLDPHGTVMAGIATCMAHGELGQEHQMATAAAQSMRVLDTAGQATHLRGPVTEVYATGLTSSGRIVEALEVADHFAHSSYGQLAVMQIVAAQILGMAHLAAGNLREALQHLPADVDTQDWTGRGFLSMNSFPRFHLLRAQALARSGEPDSAEQALYAARALRHPAYHYYQASDLLAEAWIAAARSQSGHATALARTAADFAREHHQRAREVWCLQTAVQFFNADTKVVDRLSELAGELGTERALVAAGYAAALQAGDAAALETASRDFEMMGDRLAAADAAAQSATSHRRAGHTSGAIAAAARARRLATLCGGATSPAIVSAEFTAPLTDREREIVALVTRGMSNRQIAQAMSLSVRTVESHIYRASSKTGVIGRAGLRAIE